MRKETIIVPKGIRYISEWREQYGYTLPDYPCIIDKKITGCGFTEECIRNNENIVLCSPRRALLENKFQQHTDDVFYLRNEFEKIIDIDKDLTTTKSVIPIESASEITNKALQFQIQLRQQLESYIAKCQSSFRPCKILVTYDSFRIVKEVLEQSELLKYFRVVIDEFQSIFTDSRFKAGTEIEFLYHLKHIQKINFVSATPMLEIYLDKLDEFNSLPLIEFDWETEDSSRLIRPEINVRTLRNKSLIVVASEIINSYLNGDFKKQVTRDETGRLVEIEAREAVIYVNSVKNICDIIKKSKLLPEQINILCSDTKHNQSRITKSLKSLNNGNYLIGKVPLLGEDHKMFTICTRTVYLGADFYSKCARSFILSDANIECLAVDITLDLPQILGRQRLDCNPWKNRADMYVKLLSVKNKKTVVEFNQLINSKLEKTQELLELYLNKNNNVSEVTKFAHAEKLLKDVKNSNYKDDYVSVNIHTKGTLEPVFNKLVMISEQRAFEIQQIDYADRFSIFGAIKEEGFALGNRVSEFLNIFLNLRDFKDRMRLLCDSNFNSVDLDYIFKQIPIEYKNYYTILGPERIKSLSYIKIALKKAFLKETFSNTMMEDKLYQIFQVGSKYLLSDIKQSLGDLYIEYGNPNKPKAVDLNNYFELKNILITLPNKTRAKGYELIKKIQ